MTKALATMSEAAGVPRRRRKSLKKVGPYSQEGALAKLDGRTKYALFMRERRNELIAHVGGKPNAIQRVLIERAVRCMLALELMDEKLTHGTVFTARGHNHYLAWANSLRRTLQAIGIKEADRSSARPNLNEYLANKSRRRSSEARGEAA